MNEAPPGPSGKKAKSGQRDPRASGTTQKIIPNLNVNPILRTGVELLKFGSRGRPHPRTVRVDSATQRLSWGSSKKQGFAITELITVVSGVDTATFRRRGNRKTAKAAPTLCFSLLTSKRTLDLRAPTHDQQQVLIQAFAQLITDIHTAGGGLSGLSELDVREGRTRVRRGSRNRVSHTSGGEVSSTWEGEERGATSDVSGGEREENYKQEKTVSNSEGESGRESIMSGRRSPSKSVGYRYWEQDSDASPDAMAAARTRKAVRKAKGGYADCLTPEQEAIVARLATRHADDGDADLGLIPDEARVHYFCRFARARNWNWDSIVEMLDAHLVWRRTLVWGEKGEAGVASLAATALEVVVGESPSTIEVIRHLYPRGFHGISRDGQPVMVMRSGKQELTKLMEHVTEQKMLLYDVWHQEELMRVLGDCSRFADRHIETAVGIVDLDGFGWKNMSRVVFAILQAQADIASSHYPETMDRLFIVNSPRLFQTAWRVIRRWLPTATREKIAILGEDFLDEVGETIDLGQVPLELGGECDHARHGYPNCWTALGQHPLDIIRNLSSGRYVVSGDEDSE